MSRKLNCLYSTVRNTSGGRKKFAFLPPHGRELAANEEFTVFGQLTEAVIRFDRTCSQRHIAALEGAIDRTDLLVVNTPAMIMESPGGTSRMLQIDNHNNLSLTDPCWTSLSSTD